MNNLAFRTYAFVLSSALLAGLEPPSAALQEEPFNVLLRTVDMCYNRRVNLRTLIYALNDSHNAEVAERTLHRYHLLSEEPVKSSFK